MIFNNQTLKYIDVPYEMEAELRRCGWKVISAHAHNHNQAILKIEREVNMNWDLKDIQHYNSWVKWHTYSKNGGWQKNDEGKLKVSLV